MPEIEVSLRRASGPTNWPLGDDPVVLRFFEPSFHSAEWKIAGYQGEIPAMELDQLLVRDGLMVVSIEGPTGEELGNYVASRVKMGYPEPSVCCIMNELPNAESPTAWSEWHVKIRGTEIIVEQQTPDHYLGLDASLKL